MCVKEKEIRAQKPGFNFPLQWHITAKCDQKCKHCYMYDSPFYQSEMKNELSLEECFRVVDDYVELVKRWNIQGSISLTGGDPLLRENFFDLLKYIKEQGIYNINIMGNPFHITKETAKKMKEHGVLTYQISLDGLRETHDYFRKPGSFDASLEAYQILRDAGIKIICMTTVSNANKGELINLVNFVTKIPLDGYDFDRLVPVGAGSSFSDDIIPKEEYHQLLHRVQDEYDRLKAEGCHTYFGHKDPLWHLVLRERGKEVVSIDGDLITKGCLIGWAGCAILADGSVMACRRLPIVVGKVPEESLAEVFVKSEKMKELREHNKIKKCRNCKYFCICRGCRAVSFGYSNGDVNAADPYCWYEGEES